MERKYRFALRRDALQLHVPAVVRGSLFLHEEGMDMVDQARYAQLLAKRRELEDLYHAMRANQSVLEKTDHDYKEIVEYEDKLYKDLTRGGGGGLVRKLGGQKAAAKVLEDTQASLAALASLRLTQKVCPARGWACFPWCICAILWTCCRQRALGVLPGAACLTQERGRCRKLCGVSKRTSNGCTRATLTRSSPARSLCR